MTSQVLIFDTTLRDGEQAPGAAMTIEQKVRIARALELAKVDVIEAGFPIASETDFLTVGKIAREVRESEVCALARAKREDIQRAHEALVGAAVPRIHTFIATSDLHIREKLLMSHEDVLGLICWSIRFARSLVPNVQWSAEDATRSDPDFLCRCVETAIAAGARTINLPDTVGCMIPDRYEELIREVRGRVPNADRAVFSVHCHNDLGLATANSLAGISAGASQVECTINGIGERAGNAALEEVVIALRVHDSERRVRFDTTHLTRLSRMVAVAAGFVVPRTKAIVGRNALAHGSGIHQDGVLKSRGTYEIIDPAVIGAESDVGIVITRHSGRKAVQSILTDAGCVIDDEEFERVYGRIMEIAAEKKEVLPEEVHAIADDRQSAHKGPYEVLSCNVSLEATDGVRTACAQVKVRVSGKTSTHEHTSKLGEVDACLEALRIAVATFELHAFQVVAIGETSGALAEVRITLSQEGRECSAVASDTSTAIAALKACVNALNKLAACERALS